MPIARRKPEVMSPAGYWPQLQAAVEAGADSIYFGLKHFTARAKVGFALSELPEVFRTLHGRGVRGFITFNTLVFDDELDEAARAIAAIASAGADAIIVQDAGVLAIAGQVAPDLEIHASTQMSITDARGARLAAEMGVERVTLARELSLEEIAAIAAATDVELECFVHGALCVAYSGQCFSSEAWGGRSANRGQCAQACRLPYDLLVDGTQRDLDDARYLLSPGDLYALEHVARLTEIGVSALKIEGRYKEAEYVAATTAAYRKAVDEAWAGEVQRVSAEERLKLEQVYSRGLGAYFLAGTDHQSVVRGRAPRHRGVLMGRVERVTEAGVVMAPAEAHRVMPLTPGDGLVFDAGDWRSVGQQEEGGRVYSVTPVSHGRLELTFGNRDLDPARIHPGDLVWRSDAPQLERALRVYTAASAPVRRQRVDASVVARAGEKLRSTWNVGRHEVKVESAAPLGVAQNRPVTPEFVRQQLDRLGGTAYELGDLRLECEGGPFLPASMLNQLRRDAVELLQLLQSTPRAVTVNAWQRPAWEKPSVTPGAAAMLHLLVRTPEQLDAALELRPDSITLDYLDLYGLKPSVERVRQAGLNVRVASTRILKPGEEKIGEFLHRLDCPILVRPAGLLTALPGRELTGDFSLNAANALSAQRYLAMGLERITPAHDLNGKQVTALARQLGGERLEAIAYQHLPVFHTEHCVFCRFLSTGTSYKDCGRPCEKHRVELRDPSGRAHPLLADVGCRNTVFGAEAQEASAFLAAWRAAGIRHFRLEFAHESAEEVRRITQAFRGCLAGTLSAAELRAEVGAVAPQGSTQGSLFVPVSAIQRAAL